MNTHILTKLFLTLLLVGIVGIAKGQDTDKEIADKTLLCVSAMSIYQTLKDDVQDECKPLLEKYNSLNSFEEKQNFLRLSTAVVDEKNQWLLSDLVSNIERCTVKELNLTKVEIMPDYCVALYGSNFFKDSLHSLMPVYIRTNNPFWVEQKNIIYPIEN